MVHGRFVLASLVASLFVFAPKTFAADLYIPEQPARFDVTKSRNSPSAVARSTRLRAPNDAPRLTRARDRDVDAVSQYSPPATMPTSDAPASATPADVAPTVIATVADQPELDATPITSPMPARSLAARPAVLSQNTSSSPASSPPVVDKNQKEKVGRLNCDVATGIGLIIGSSKKLSCTFMRPGMATEDYNGHMNLLGIDIGISRRTKASWNVLASAASDLPGNSLEGIFISASASATAGAGISGKTLAGGSDNGILLEPASDSDEAGSEGSSNITSVTLSRADG